MQGIKAVSLGDTYTCASVGAVTNAPSVSRTRPPCENCVREVCVPNTLAFAPTAANRARRPHYLSTQEAQHQIAQGALAPRRDGGACVAPLDPGYTPPRRHPRPHAHHWHRPRDVAILRLCGIGARLRASAPTVLEVSLKKRCRSPLDPRRHNAVHHGESYRQSRGAHLE